METWSPNKEDNLLVDEEKKADTTKGMMTPHLTPHLKGVMLWTRLTKKQKAVLVSLPLTH